VNAELLCAIAAAALLSATPARGEHLEAKMYAISDWDTECPGSDRDMWDDMADNWYDEITDHGWYHKAGRQVNGNMDRDIFCDPDTGLANCDDGSRLDAADAAIIALHGADSGNHWRGSLRRNGGASVNDCNIDGSESAVPGGELHAGDVDLEFLHLSSCFSMDDDNLPFTYFNFEDAVDSPVNGRRLHQLDGFHGIMYIGGCCDDQYEDFADDAFDVSIKEAWLDNMYVTGINGSSTQCPVAYAVGRDRNDCFDRIDHERYNNVRSDPGAIGYYCYYYYDGCDPDGETPFTDPN
jgi:hypothetical protein